MEKGLTSICIFLSVLSCFAQSNPEPFIIKGKLANCPENKLLIYIENEPGMTEVDTIYVKPNGSFYFETTNVTKPHRTSIQRNNVQFNDLFVAPGYELTVTADVKDFQTLLKTRKFSGRGGKCNAYQLLVDSLEMASDLLEVKWYTLDTEELISYIDKHIALRERARREVFGQKVSDDPYFDHFNRTARMDNMFYRLYYLTAYINMGKVPLEEGEAFLTKYFDQDVLAHLFEEKWLISNVFKDFIILHEYLRFIRDLDYQRDSTLKSRKDYSFQKVSTLFQGKLRDYAILQMAHLQFLGCKSIQQLNERRELFQPYLDKLESPEYQNYLNRKLEGISAKLGKIQVGGLAPEFTLKDQKGETHKLSDFRGKIVYIDLWASWCAPCREETPFLNELIRSYENDERVAFVSIAVRDDYSDWQKALAEDQPLSLQLYDEERFVYSTYLMGSIPQFVLINREGNIVSINAPRPSQKKALVEALEAALED